MRSLQHECLSVGLVLCLPAAICLSFPFESLRFRAKDVPSECAASAAFVILSPEEETAALLSAKTAWQSDESAGRRMRIRLPLGELPEDPGLTSLEVETSPLTLPPPDPLPYQAHAWTPSQKASAPVRIPQAENPVGKQTFPREELLKLN